LGRRDFAQESSASLREKLLKLTSAPAATIRSDGDFEKTHAAAANKSKPSTKFLSSLTPPGADELHRAFPRW